MSERVSSIGRLSSWLVLGYDLLSVAVSWGLAVWLGLNFQRAEFTLSTVSLRDTVIALIAYLLMYRFYGTYRPLWRYVSIDELLTLVKTVVFATFVFMIAAITMSGLARIPHSAFVIFPVLVLVFLAGARLVCRLIYATPRHKVSAKKVLIVGAGRGADLFLRELDRLEEASYQIVALVDDDVALHGKELRGARVRGAVADIPVLSKELEVDQIVVAIPSVSSKKLRAIMNLCREAGKPVRILPSLHDITSGRVSVADLQEVSLEDLLGRDPIKLDVSRVEKLLRQKTVFVTGGAGSIGSELCRQIAQCAPAKVVVIDQNEFGLYSIEQEFSKRFPAIHFEYRLCDVVDKTSLQSLFLQYKPQVVFHAAAYKHVPMLEEQANMAVLNNVLGTRSVAMLAAEYNVEKFILISTDKAVNPTNIMGATKRCAEIFCQNYNHHVDTAFITVRFGNVLGSSGSVIPLFKKQLEQGGPLTVTHPDVERYFMTIPEASQLVLQAGALGNGGEIFVLDMGESVKIADLAKQLIHLSGKKLGEDIEIAYTGLRPGEKIYEELFHATESLAPTSIQKIRIAEARSVGWQEVEEKFAEFTEGVYQGDGVLVLSALQALVPEASFDTNK